jgi:DNA-binding NarL/FixJ family response regulator
MGAVESTPLHRPRRILLVDDSAVFIRTVREFLGARPELAIASAETAATGLQLAVRIDPHLVLLDFSLPDMNGIECARCLRGAGSRAAIVLVSGHDLTLVQDLARHAGVDGLVAKWRFATAIGAWL